MSITRSPLSRPRRRGLLPLAAAVAMVAGSALVLNAGETASAQPSPAGVLLGTAGNYSVLAGSAVTNTGFSVLGQSVGLSPGLPAAITGFPDGIVQPPATIAAGDAVTLQAQIDLVTAYNDAAARPTTATVSADLGGQTLVAGVYTGGALGLTGQLTLNGQNDPNSVFVFQAASTLTTASASSVLLINGANPCNIFWQVGSSATLGTNSDFIGTILALTSITLTTDADVEGRALARNGAVTLDDNTFTQPNCQITIPTTTTTPAGGTTIPGGGTTPATPIGTTPGATVPFVATDITLPRTGGTPTNMTLPSTGGRSLAIQAAAGAAVILAGLAAMMLARRRQPA